MKFKGLSILLTCALISCGSGSDKNVPDTTGNGGSTEAISKDNRVIYELNVLNYSASGKLSAVTSDISRLKELGVDIIWLMPIYPIGEVNKNGSLGSPYAVKNYKEVNPNFGTMADLQNLVKEAHANNMEIWLDWVANHTAWDNVWTTEHLDFYATNSNGNRPYSPGDGTNTWTDVIQLDYSNTEMCDSMISAMKFWVQQANIDGYRCDAASYVPLAFWKKARTAVDAVKAIEWLAEDGSSTVIDAFDYDYAWSFNDALNSFGTTKTVSTLKTACEALYNNTKYSGKGRMVYLTNHDLSASSGTEFTRYGSFVLPLTVLSFTIYDIPLLYNGQEIGYNQSMGLFDKATISWTPVNATMNTLIKKLVQLKHTQTALTSGANRGTLTFLATSNSNVLAYTRKKGANEVIVMLNLSSASTNVSFNDSNPPSGTYTNYLTDKSVTLSMNSSITLSANGYVIFVK